MIVLLIDKNATKVAEFKLYTTTYVVYNFQNKNYVTDRDVVLYEYSDQVAIAEIVKEMSELHLLYEVAGF